MSLNMKQELCPVLTTDGAVSEGQPDALQRRSADDITQQTHAGLNLYIPPLITSITSSQRHHGTLLLWVLQELNYNYCCSLHDCKLLFRKN